jgi:hypothetical protein
VIVRVALAVALAGRVAAVERVERVAWPVDR